MIQNEDRVRYEGLLRARGLKATPHRVMILALLEASGHLSIEQLFLQLKESISPLSLATIYKNIHLMTQKELLREIKLPSQKSLYEIKKAPHAHLECRKCHRVWDLLIDPQKSIQGINQETLPIRVDSVALVLSGECSSCSA